MIEFEWLDAKSYAQWRGDSLVPLAKNWTRRGQSKSWTKQPRDRIASPDATFTGFHYTVFLE